MLIERIWAANALRNFHYLIACSQTGEALIVDPLDAEQCLTAARAAAASAITQILNTHEHRDHTDGQCRGGRGDRREGAGACRRGAAHRRSG